MSGEMIAGPLAGGKAMGHGLGKGLGIGAGGRHGFETVVNNRIDRLEHRVESGKLDPTKLQARLDRHFGEAAAGIVGENGVVDFDRLQSLIIETRIGEAEAEQADGVGTEADGAAPADLPESPLSRFETALASLFGESQPSLIDADGMIDGAALQAALNEDILPLFEEQLLSLFGEAADGIIGSDGSVDLERLQALISAPTVASTDTSTPAESDAPASAEMAPTPPSDATPSDEPDSGSVPDERGSARSYGRDGHPGLHLGHRHSAGHGNPFGFFDLKA